MTTVSILGRKAGDRDRDVFCSTYVDDVCPSPHPAASSLVHTPINKPPPPTHTHSLLTPPAHRCEILRGGMEQYLTPMGPTKLHVHPIFEISPLEPRYSEWLVFEGISVDETGKQHYLDATVAYKRAVLNCIDYLSKFGYTKEQVGGGRVMGAKRGHSRGAGQETRLGVSGAWHPCSVNLRRLCPHPRLMVTLTSPPAQPPLRRCTCCCPVAPVRVASAALWMCPMLWLPWPSQPPSLTKTFDPRRAARLWAPS